MDQMVDVTVEGEWLATLRISSDPDQPAPSPNAYVAEAQAELAERGYVLDNEVTYVVRAPGTGEQTRYAADA